MIIFNRGHISASRVLFDMALHSYRACKKIKSLKNKIKTETSQKDLGDDAFLPLPPREILESGQASWRNSTKSKLLLQMQPLEMILGFNKDEGLHVIIDLLMDPTNDTNFRMVHNKFYKYKCKLWLQKTIHARFEKAGWPTAQRCSLTNMRTKSLPMFSLWQTWWNLLLPIIMVWSLDQH